MPNRSVFFAVCLLAGCVLAASADARTRTHQPTQSHAHASPRNVLYPAPGGYYGSPTMDPWTREWIMTDPFNIQMRMDQ